MPGCIWHTSAIGTDRRLRGRQPGSAAARSSTAQDGFIEHLYGHPTWIFGHAKAVHRRPVRRTQYRDVSVSDSSLQEKLGFEIDSLDGAPPLLRFGFAARAARTFDSGARHYFAEAAEHEVSDVHGLSAEFAAHGVRFA
jgi:hypothetical protein